jgi:hypothetical protein
MSTDHNKEPLPGVGAYAAERALLRGHTAAVLVEVLSRIFFAGDLGYDLSPHPW